MNILEKMCNFTPAQLLIILALLELIPIYRLAAIIGPILIVWSIISATLQDNELQKDCITAYFPKRIT